MKKYKKGLLTHIFFYSIVIISSKTMTEKSKQKYAFREWELVRTHKLKLLKITPELQAEIYM
ncbi:Conserved hypothetical protein [Clostridium acetobutylicum EA 2018]|uniref:Uncharacterized protein n=1 Tax=Clostridium acetobutylicum (strain ATCC 824 / DSM 792 / JCM 1419 / IAM 19013 / LMG 5710 / NBRC 13948 / NRRL B-527 / VKM B-1787 / 2291 / W) TaxID=272562 RepID=Q97ED8_CLOAB|nr:Hypothetical protein CA_C3175 [Clostridium acetobutylicum ATCC 824]ADZ22216.1 Conserved hypothetical protein [Clostridium acetobutylicum EA 2018]AEI32699.1 hypothetical protein SMB_G3211 [Clostridium acetobutylicum DSM 1731]AWV82088.1 hypothetical protein DK921_18820 [Clostridium acetobutylicum]PSM04164.1 hypothetical protein C7T89_19725 [Clostridium sp. NJ4]